MKPYIKIDHNAYLSIIVESADAEQIESDKVWDALKKEAILRILKNPTKKAEDNYMLLSKQDEIPLSRLAYSLNDIIEGLIKEDPTTQLHQQQKHSANKKTIHEHADAAISKKDKILAHPQYQEEAHRGKESSNDELKWKSKDHVMQKRKRQSARPFINTRWGDSSKVKNELHEFDDLLDLSFTR